MENQIEIYQSSDGKTHIEVKFERETVWLSQEQIGNLFLRERSVITKHISNVFKENELDEKSNVQILHIAFSDRPVKYYSLDVIISVGHTRAGLEGDAGFFRLSGQHRNQRVKGCNKAGF
jgi:hypothetical protein